MQITCAPLTGSFVIPAYHGDGHNTEKRVSPVDALPDEVLVNVLHGLEKDCDRASFRLVSRRFCTISSLNLTKLRPLQLPKQGAWPFRGIRHLDLARLPNPVQCEELTRLSSFTHLLSLNIIDGSLLTDEASQIIQNFKKRRNLSLIKTNALTNMGLRSLVAGAPIRRLNLSQSQCAEFTSIEPLIALTQLEELRLNYCSSLQAPGLAELSQLSRLTSLALVGGQGGSDEGLNHIQPLQLRQLIIGGNRLTYHTFQILSRLESLRVLGIFYSQTIEEWHLTYLRSLSDLRILSLMGCGRISQRCFTKLRDLKSLEILDLFRCRVSRAFCWNHESKDRPEFTIEVTAPKQTAMNAHAHHYLFLEERGHEARLRTRVIRSYHRSQSLTAEHIQDMPQEEAQGDLPPDDRVSALVNGIHSSYTQLVYEGCNDQWRSFLRDIERLGLNFLRNAQIAPGFDLTLIFHSLGHYPNLFFKHFEIFATNLYAVLSLIEHRVKIFNVLPAEMKGHSGVIKAYLTTARKPEDEKLRIPSNLENDRLFFTRLVNKNGSAIRLASPDIRSNMGIALLALTNDWEAMQHLHHRLKSRPQFVRSAIGIHALTLKFAHLRPYTRLDLMQAVKNFYTSSSFGRIETRMKQAASGKF